jgi:orotidine-5'-phosphate decarboxylase
MFHPEGQHPVTSPRSAKDKIIVALDVPGEAAALHLVRELSAEIGFFKIGLELFTRCGPSIVDRVRGAARDAGRDRCGIFLDLKLHDIPNTVAGAVRAAASLDVDLLTLHLSGGGAMIRAAAQEAGERLLLLGVSVLTSIDEATLSATGVSGSVQSQVARLSELALANGLRGVVASPWEVTALREQFGRSLTLVIPGVRPDAGAAVDDQSRVMTPRRALDAGADFLVIGRPITAQPDPAAAARAIIADLPSGS